MPTSTGDSKRVRRYLRDTPQTGCLLDQTRPPAATVGRRSKLSRVLLAKLLLGDRVPRRENREYLQVINQLC